MVECGSSVSVVTPVVDADTFSDVVDEPSDPGGVSPFVGVVVPKYGDVVCEACGELSVGGSVLLGFEDSSFVDSDVPSVVGVFAEVVECISGPGDVDPIVDVSLSSSHNLISAWSFMESGQSSHSKHSSWACTEMES